MTSSSPWLWVRRPIVQITVAMLATTLAYSNAFKGSFQFDDFAAIVDNPRLVSWPAYAESAGRMVRPLLYFTFTVDHSWFGADAPGYHGLNLLLHLGCGVLLFRISTRATMGGSPWIPAMTATVFLLHPLATEAVTYISGRAASLMTFFYLASLLLFVDATEGDRSPVSRRRRIGASLACFAASLLAKETAMTLPLALLCWDGLIRRYDAAQLRRAWLRDHLPYWIALAISGLWACAHARYVYLAQYSFGIRPPGSNALGEMHAMVCSIGLLLRPWDLNFDHDLAAVTPAWSGPFAIDALVVALLAIAACAGRRRLPAFAFGIAFYAIQWLPIVVIPRVDLLSERNLYLADAGLILAMVALALRAANRIGSTVKRPVAVALRTACLLVALAVCASCLGTLSYRRNALYADPVLLWTDAVAKSPLKARPHNNLGHAYASRGDWDRAIGEFRKAIGLRPDYVLAQQNLRAAYLHQVGRL